MARPSVFLTMVLFVAGLVAAVVFVVIRLELYAPGLSVIQPDSDTVFSHLVVWMEMMALVAVVAAISLMGFWAIEWKSPWIVAPGFAVGLIVAFEIRFKVVDLMVQTFVDTPFKLTPPAQPLNDPALLIPAGVFAGSALLAALRGGKSLALRAWLGLGAALVICVSLFLFRAFRRESGSDVVAALRGTYVEEIYPFLITGLILSFTAVAVLMVDRRVRFVPILAVGVLIGIVVLLCGGVIADLGLAGMPLGAADYAESFAPDQARLSIGAAIWFLGLILAAVVVLASPRTDQAEVGIYMKVAGEND